MNRKKIFLLCFLFPVQLFAQQKNIDYFVNGALKNNPNIAEINNLQQYFKIQNEFITAQNKKPQVSFTADYLFAPFFFDNGNPINVTPTPSATIYGTHTKFNL